MMGTDSHWLAGRTLTDTSIMRRACVLVCVRVKSKDNLTEGAPVQSKENFPNSTTDLLCKG